MEEEYSGARQWSRDKQAVFTVVWISFLVAAIGTMVFFALFDPVDLSGIFDPDLDIGRDAGYAAGFFFFWALCALCSAVTAYLIRTAPKRKKKPRKQ
jgi:phosphotransferase system  glucose/maltose/N-acetylglucosamine-specific IIC component